MKTLLIGFFVLQFTFVFSQLSTYYTQDQFFYNNAQNHYLKDAYRGSAYDFESLINFDTHLNEKQTQFAELYSTNVALLYGDSNAIEAFTHYQEKYPNSPLSEQMNYTAGLYYLQQGNKEKALQYLRKADISGFSESRKTHYYFTLGYVYFQEREYDKATSELQKVQDKTPYEKPKAYMLGHIAYTKKNYEQAIQFFEKIKDDPEYQSLIQPYLVQIYFNQGNYEKASAMGKELLNSGAYSSLQTELSKIVGESEFRLQHYAEATPYLQSYVDHAEKVTMPDYYQLGYVYYHQKNYAKAVENFNKIVHEQSPLSQNAFYQLGNSYLQNGQKKEALSAFKSASEMNYDPVVQENALYTYAQLSYDIGNPYEAASEAIQLYLKKYPNSNHQKEMENLLVSSFLHSKNYKGALDAIQKIPNPSPELQQTQQTLALMYGIELYNSGKFASSILYFNQAIALPNPSANYAKALYWKGEAHYQLGQYNEALSSFKMVETTTAQIPERQQLPYEMAYCYLKLEDFSAAKNYFQRYLTQPKAEYKADAQLRLADSYFGNQEIDKAIDTYGEIENTGEYEQDFAAFQKAKLYGFKNDLPKQIEALVNFVKTYPNSTYIEQAQYELGIAYQKDKDYFKSIVAFDNVLKTKRSTELTALAMIGKGNDYTALKEYNRALNIFKEVASEFKNTDYAKQAVLASKTVYIEQGNISEYQKFAQQNGVNFSNEENEELSFLEAQKLYLEKNYTAAIPLLSKFIQRYPQSTRTLTVKYYMGNSYYQTQKDQEAIQYLEPIAQQQNEYQEDALYSLGRIYLDNENDEKAKLAYEALYTLTQNKSYQSVCEVELMYLYEGSGNTTQATEMAQKVLTNDKNSAAVTEQAHLIIARSKIKTNPKEAEQAFKALEKAKNPSVQAEAKYYNAYFKTENKQYKDSNDIIFELTSNLSNEQYWGAKALIIMAKNYYYLNDKYQASYILDEVIGSYAEYPDVVQEAKTLKSQLKL